MPSLWQVVIPFWLNGWLVALADIWAGCFVLTSLARQDVKHTSAKLIAVSALPYALWRCTGVWPDTSHWRCCARVIVNVQMR